MNQNERWDSGLKDGSRGAIGPLAWTGRDPRPARHSRVLLGGEMNRGERRRTVLGPGQMGLCVAALIAMLVGQTRIRQFTLGGKKVGDLVRQRICSRFRPIAPQRRTGQAEGQQHRNDRAETGVAKHG